VPLDPGEAEARYRREPAEPADPERLCLRRWALTLIDEAFDTLEAEYSAAGKGALFDRLRAGLLGDSGDTYAAIRREVGMYTDAVKQAATRLRARFGRDEPGPARPQGRPAVGGPSESSMPSST
jgi:hypothetical protein